MPSQGDLFETNFAREVIEIPVQQEMSESFLAYSLSVITSRAIPDVRDGLKPVHRRVNRTRRVRGSRGRISSTSVFTFDATLARSVPCTLTYRSIAGRML